jgi:hypothetical protein
MRNTIVQTLPPHADLTFDIDPPMTADERPYLLALKGKASAVVRVVHSGCISVTNPTAEPSVFMLTIGPVMTLPPGLHAAISSFLAARKNPS